MGVFWRGRLEEWAGGLIRPNRDAPQGPTATIAIQQPDQQVNTCNVMQRQTAVAAQFIYEQLLLLLLYYRPCSWPPTWTRKKAIAPAVQRI